MKGLLDRIDTGRAEDVVHEIRNALDCGIDRTTIYHFLYLDVHRMGLNDRRATVISDAMRLLVSDRIESPLRSDCFDILYAWIVRHSAFFCDRTFMRPREEAIDQLKRQITEDAERFGVLPIHLLYLGSCAYMSLEYEAAKTLFDGAIKARTKEVGLRFYNMGAGTFVPPLVKFVKSGLTEFNHAGTSIRKVDGRKTAIFTADVKYARAFAPAIIRKFSEQNAEAALHFHIINPDGMILDEILLEASLRKRKVGVSTEDTDIVDSAYYAMARLFKLPFLLEATSGDIVVFDIDVDIKHSVDSYFAALGEADVSLLYNNRWHRAFPWLSVSAGAVYLARSNHGKGFGKFVASQASTHFDTQIKAPRLWTDQNLLSFCDRLYRVWHPDAVFVNSRAVKMPWTHDIAYQRKLLGCNPS